MSITIRPATRADAEFIAFNLRPSDRAEVEASAKQSPQEALVRSFEASRECFVAVADGDPVAIFGVGLVGDVAVPWMLGTPVMRRYPVEVLRRAKAYVRRWLAEHRVLVNFVDARNKTSIRFLTRLGFTILPPQPHGPYGMPFHFFYMGSLHV